MKKFIFLFLFLFGGCSLFNNNNDPAVVNPAPVSFVNRIDIGTVNEKLICVVKFNDKIIWGPYLDYNKMKMYAINFNDANPQIYTYYTNSGIYESVFTLFVRDNAVLTASTEQPPEQWAREVGSGWGRQIRYADRGWAVLGNATANGKYVRGYFYNNRKIKPVMKIYSDGSWKDLGKPIYGVDGSGRIVWHIEYFNGKYYAGTAWAENSGYKQALCGNIYSLDEVSGNWTPVYGHEAGKPCGSVVAMFADDNRLFAGTSKPPRLLILDNTGKWTENNYGDGGRVGNFWKDNNNHIFTARYDASSFTIKQWNYSTKAFDDFYTAPGSNLDLYYWGVLGICTSNTEMYVKIPENGKSKIMKIGYK